MLARMVRSYGNRVSEGDIESLAGMAQFVAEAEAELAKTVHRLRSEEGGAYSWAQIGAQLGMSRQAAQKRFGDPDKTGARTVGGQPANLR